MRTTKIVLGILFAIFVIVFVYLSISVWVVESLQFTDVSHWMVASFVGAGFFGWFLFKGR